MVSRVIFPASALSIAARSRGLLAGITTAAASGNRNFPNQFGEQLTALGVLGRLAKPNICPLTVSGHRERLKKTKLPIELPDGFYHRLRLLPTDETLLTELFHDKSEDHSRFDTTGYDATANSPNTVAN